MSKWLDEYMAREVRKLVACDDFDAAYETRTVEGELLPVMTMRASRVVRLENAREPLYAFAIERFHTKDWQGDVPMGLVRHLANEMNATLDEWERGLKEGC